MMQISIIVSVSMLVSQGFYGEFAMWEFLDCASGTAKTQTPSRSEFDSDFPQLADLLSAERLSPAGADARPRILPGENP